MFVGPNGSGKSNAILVLRFLLDALFTEAKVFSPRSSCLFAPNRIMKLEYDFAIDDKIIKYQIEYHFKDKILIENLSLDEKNILCRTGTVGHTEITEKTDYDDVPQDLLMLRYIWFNTKFSGNAILVKWFNFLSRTLYADFSKHTIASCEICDGDPIELDLYLKNEGTDRINSFLSSIGANFSVYYKNDGSEDNIGKCLFFKRGNIKYQIPFAYESFGNIMFMYNLPAYLSAVDSGGIYICDEFSSCMHNELEELLVQYYMDHVNNGQIFVVTHSSNLLSSSLLRPDQIYAVEFDNKGSHIKRFSERQPRFGQNFEKMYLGGAFGGLPNYRYTKDHE
jgi:AAA15 family ATPase/GTPase